MTIQKSIAQREKEIEKCILAHLARNVKLLEVLSKKGVDLREPRGIDCYFWSLTETSADSLCERLSSRGFNITAKDGADPDQEDGKWNVEAQIRQSIDLTVRKEFVDEMVRLADSSDSIFDGWGASI
jgi:hypothetical protein